MRRPLILLLACALAPALLAAAAQAETTDGQWVLVDNSGAAERLLTINPSTHRGLARGEHVRYAAPTGSRLDAPQWSPDGNRIAFVERAPGGATRLLVHELASGAVTEVAAGAHAPTWSADGSRIAFERDSRLLTRRADGSDEQGLPIDGAGVRDLAWSPDGSRFALWVGDRIDLVAADGEGRETVAEDAVGGPAWAPDSVGFTYSRYTDGQTVLGWVDAEDGTLDVLSHSGWTPFRVDLEPDFSPTGDAVVFVHRAADGSSASLSVAQPSSVTGEIGALVPSEPDWQPCTAGVTTSCVSATPPIPAPPGPTCPASTTLSTVAGRAISVGVACSTRVTYEIVEPPAHGTIANKASTILAYTPAAGFTGEDTFTYRAKDFRGGVSAVSRVVIQVAPKPLRPAAPKLAVTGTPRLDRRGRVVLRGTCDRACTATLRVRIKTNTGLFVDGRWVKGSAPSGGPITVRLKRGKLPARRRIASVRVVGRLRGADGLERGFTLTLKR